MCPRCRDANGLQRCYPIEPVSQPPTYLDLVARSDGRGQLSVLDSWGALPFTPVRLFLVTDVPTGIRRGGHAWREGHEFLVCVTGSCTIDAEWGSCRATFVLDRPDRGLYLPPMVWMEYEHASPSTSLVVLASTHHDPTDVIHDHGEFLRLASPPP